MTGVGVEKFLNMHIFCFGVLGVTLAIYCFHKKSWPHAILATACFVQSLGYLWMKINTASILQQSIESSNNMEHIANSFRHRFFLNSIAEQRLWLIFYCLLIVAAIGLFLSLKRPKCNNKNYNIVTENAEN